MPIFVTIPSEDISIVKDMLYVNTGTNEAGTVFSIIRIEDILSKITDSLQNHGLIPLEKRTGMTED